MHLEDLSTLSKAGVSVAMKITGVSIIVVLALFLAINRPEYLPSISEAAARGIPRLVNSVGVGLGGSLFLVSGILWLICGYKQTEGWAIHAKIIFAFVVHLISSVSLVSQAIIPINMRAETCIHRTFAAIFFLTAFLLCYLFENIERAIREVCASVRTLRSIVLFVGVSSLVFGGNLATAWGNFMSHNPRLAELHALTGFSCIQYIIVFSLLIYVYTFSLN